MLNYESVQPWPVEEVHDKLDLGLEETYKVSEDDLRPPDGRAETAGAKWDKTRIIYNSHVTIAKIPLSIRLRRQRQACEVDKKILNATGLPRQGQRHRQRSERLVP